VTKTKKDKKDKRQKDKKTQKDKKLYSVKIFPPYQSGNIS
jgi:hypothetical protein